MTSRFVAPRLAVAAAVLASLLAAAAWAASPIVSNVQFAQRADGSRLVDVTYDLADADGDSCAITLLASDDGGATWTMPCTRCSGDVGPGVAPGTGRGLVWDFGYDNPGWEGDAYRVRVVASDLGTLFPPHSPRLVAINDWTAINWALPGQFEKYARADIVVVQAPSMWGHPANEALRVADNIKAVNPDCRVVGYVLGKTSVTAWESPTSSAFAHAWWERTRPYWSYTTTGDTLSDWPGQVVVNILDPACRAAMVNTIVEYQRLSNNKLDGIFWDYFNKSLWISPGADPLVDGEPDLDGDGVAHWSDADELVAYRAAEVALVQAVRDSLGEGFIQIFNGQRAYADSTFAALSDGMFYEQFPEVFFPRPYTVATAMDPAYAYNLFRTVNWPRKINGGPYNILASWQRNYYYDDQGVLQLLLLGNLFRAIGLLAGTYAAWCPNGVWGYGWTNVDISLGEPLGPPTIDGDFYARDFKYGRIELIMDSGTHPDPFDYTIWVNGRIVELWDRPYHIP